MRSLVLLLLLSSTNSLTSAEKNVSTTVAARESLWGRLYMRDGLASIQYFRDNFGGPMTLQEVSLHFPKRSKDLFGCHLLPDPERREVKAANRSSVLIVDRGQCTFEQKARLADQMGAAALVIVSDTDDVRAPVAEMANGDEISIASVMIRRSAGDMLRHVAKHMTIFGRLIPMTCERKPYTCKPRHEVEKDYIEASSARSGFLSITKQDEDDFRVGSFLAATYGSVLNTKVSFSLAVDTEACSDVGIDGTGQLQFQGKAVLVAAGQSEQCTALQKVSKAQRRGASVVILMQSANATLMTPPSVQQSWHAYNITVPVLAVSNDVGANLARDKDTAVKVRFAVSNGVADAYELVKKFSVRAAWPKRVQRCSQKLTTLLMQVRELGGDTEVEEALKSTFVTVIGERVPDREKSGHFASQHIQTIAEIQSRDEL